ncbi:hypothetical protein AMECASPLE_029411 [Ameca splendens]|uniref:Uncharacterized protein n=1 Tax=Ameca splendens TaxID=208324 RepID=A0ABV0YSS8_9TELE
MAWTWTGYQASTQTQTTHKEPAGNKGNKQGYIQNWTAGGTNDTRDQTIRGKHRTGVGLWCREKENKALDQMKLDEVVHAWNDHRIQSTNNPRAPNGRPTLMHAVPNLYGVPHFLQPSSQTELEICLFKDFPCDVDVFHLCTELMTEHRLVMSDDVYEITNLYVRLYQMISDVLGE